MLRTELAERRRAEEELRDREEQVELALKGGDLGLWDLHVPSGEAVFNDRWSEMLGYEPGEIEASYASWAALLHPEDAPRVRAIYDEHISQRTPSYEAEFRMRAKDGSWRWILSRGRVFARDDAGEALRMVGTHLDITERKRNEQEMARLASVVEQAAETVLITDAAGRISYVNPSFVRTTGYSREEVLGSDPHFLNGEGEDEGAFEELWRTVQGGEVWHGHFTAKRKDGSVYESETTVSPVRDADGQVISYMAIERDITRELELEKQLRVSQKLEAIGQLAGGVAHDFNNILTAILGNVELALGDLEAGDPDLGELGASLEQIRESGQRAAALTQQLLAFSRRQISKPAALDLNTALGLVEPLLHRLLPENVRLELHREPGLPRIVADPAQIEQVVLNLALNARDAMPKGGTLTLETSIPKEGEFGPNREGVDVPCRVLLTVRDTGIGMDRRTLDRVFEPFFTTKGVGKGTGLGLATVYGVVRQAGGDVRVESEPGVGTTFYLAFPESEAAEEPDLATPPAARVSRSETPSRARVLFCEDDESVRDVVASMLRQGGYEVWVAEDGLDALALLDGKVELPDLLVTDVVMPDMSGRELAEKLAERVPSLATLYISGYTDDIIARHGVLEDGVVLLQKPFSRARLIEAVESELRRKERHVQD